ncbi:hypothetical protein D3C77_270590 [compost metagenome]
MFVRPLQLSGEHLRIINNLEITLEPIRCKTDGCNDQIERVRHHLNAERIKDEEPDQAAYRRDSSEQQEDVLFAVLDR